MFAPSSRIFGWRLGVAFLFLLHCFWQYQVNAEEVKHPDHAHHDHDHPDHHHHHHGHGLDLSLAEIDARLQTCEVVQLLNAKMAHEHAPTAMSKKLFAILFPSSPAINAILATAYISGPPNFILALVPANIDPGSLTVMVAFAVGGLLGDVFFHLMPQIFMGEAHDDKVHFVLLEEKRNTLLGLAIMVGFIAFVVLDKVMRLGGGGEGHSHSHGHSHGHAQGHTEDDAVVVSSTGADKPKRVTRRSAKAEAEEKEAPPKEEAPKPSSSIKVSSYLNMVADFSHNITDGLAISASFYVSPTIGAVTTTAVFFHEIPHEVGDFALLIQAGFSKSQAIMAQFVCAIGAFLGTFIGIAIHELSAGSSSAEQSVSAGLFGTSTTLGDLVLPFTAGGFLYIATVGVIPELLETGPNVMVEVRKSIMQMIALAAGAGIMLTISWNE